MEIKLSPSILSADFANLARDIKIATDAGAEYVHVDVMDGHFVPNITIGAPVVKALRRVTELTLDVHLMISDPDRYLDDFIKAGADIITVHYEANGDTRAQLCFVLLEGKAVRPGKERFDLVELIVLQNDVEICCVLVPAFVQRSERIVHGGPVFRLRGVLQIVELRAPALHQPVGNGGVQERCGKEREQQQKRDPEKSLHLALSFPMHRILPAPSSESRKISDGAW